MQDLKGHRARIYSPEDINVWQLHHQQMIGDEMNPGVLHGRAWDGFFPSLARLNIKGDHPPDFNEFCSDLYAASSWRAIEVSGATSPEALAENYALRIGLFCTHIRPLWELHFAGGPDGCHDLPGHGGMLADEVGAECGYAWGLQGRRAIRLGYMELCNRVFHGMEFGLLKTAAGFRLLGPATLTSKAEALNALHPDTVRVPFDVLRLMRTPSDDKRVQDEYSWVTSYEDLLEHLTQDWAPFYRRVAA